MPKAQSNPLSDFPVFPSPITNYVVQDSHSTLPTGWLQAWMDPFFSNYAAYWLYHADEIRKQHDANAAQPNPRPFRPADIKHLESLLKLLVKQADQYMLALNEGKKNEAQTLARKIGELGKKIQGAARKSNSGSRQLIREQSLIESDAYQSIVKRRRLEATLFHALRNIQRCNLGFRKDVICTFADWIGDVTQPPILWVNGEPGCGKSVITYWFAQKCFDNKALAASYHFTRASSPDVIQESFLANLLTDLEHYLGRPFTVALAAAVNELPPRDRDEFFVWPLRVQLEHLLVPAFRKLPPQNKRPLLVVLDGIDKCDEWGSMAVFEMIQSALERLPICFFISCYENDTVNAFLRKGPLAGQVRMCQIPFFPNPANSKTPTAASFTIPTGIPLDSENDSPPMTPLPDLTPSSNDMTDDT